MMQQKTTGWFKSSYSDGPASGCVETTHALRGYGIAPVRDSKLTVSPVLDLGVAAFGRLVEHARSQQI